MGRNMTNRCFIERTSGLSSSSLRERDSRKVTMTATGCSRFVLTSIGPRCSQANKRTHTFSRGMYSRSQCLCVEPRSVKADSVFQSHFRRERRRVRGTQYSRRIHHNIRTQDIAVIRDRQPLSVTPYRTHLRIIDFARTRLIMTIGSELPVVHNPLRSSVRSVSFSPCVISRFLSHLSIKVSDMFSNIQEKNETMASENEKNGECSRDVSRMFIIFLR